MTFHTARGVIGDGFMFAVHFGFLMAAKTTPGSGGAGMAGGAVGGTPMRSWESVVDGRRCPNGVGMALRALAGEMVRGAFGFVAARAVRSVGDGVAEDRPGPDGGAFMAARALASVVVGGLVFGVAAGAVGSVGGAVAEDRPGPDAGAFMAVGTLASVVVGGLVLCMAAGAVGGVGVVEGCACPGRCRVAL